MTTEMSKERGDLIREKGEERGTTTGRDRRIGDFDEVAKKYSDQLNGFTHIAITRLDILGETGDSRICRRYKVGSQEITRFPLDERVLERCVPDFRPGDCYKDWGDINGCRMFEELPESAKAYCQAIAGDKLWAIGVGAAREQTIYI